MKHNFGYLIREGIRGIFVHGFMSFAAVCVTVACLIIMGSFSLILYNLNATIVRYEKENQVVVFVDENYPTAEAKSVGSSINMIVNVERAEFVSREEVLEGFLEEDDEGVFTGLQANTFRDRFVVTLVDVTLMEQTVAELEMVEGVDGTSAHYDVTNGFITIQKVLNIASTAIISVLLVVSLFIISNTVKLAMYDRKEEIAIMRMVGATNAFIRWPFVVEGFVLGAMAAAIAFFLEWGLYDFITGKITEIDTMQLIEIVPFQEVLYLMIGAYAITGFIVGVFGSLMSIRKFLNV